MTLAYATDYYRDLVLVFQAYGIYPEITKEITDFSSDPFSIEVRKRLISDLNRCVIITKDPDGFRLNLCRSLCSQFSLNKKFHSPRNNLNIQVRLVPKEKVIRVVSALCSVYFLGLSPDQRCDRLHDFFLRAITFAPGNFGPGFVSIQPHLEKVTVNWDGYEFKFRMLL